MEMNTFTHSLIHSTATHGCGLGPGTYDHMITYLTVSRVIRIGVVNSHSCAGWLLTALPA